MLLFRGCRRRLRFVVVVVVVVAVVVVVIAADLSVHDSRLCAHSLLPYHLVVLLLNSVVTCHGVYCSEVVTGRCNMLSIISSQS